MLIVSVAPGKKQIFAVGTDRREAFLSGRIDCTPHVDRCCPCIRRRIVKGYEQVAVINMSRKKKDSFHRGL